jgi:hypothetical protein
VHSGQSHESRVMNARPSRARAGGGMGELTLVEPGS